MRQEDILTHCRAFPVVPVLTFDDEKRAVDLCAALLAGGAAVLEITLRGKRALACIAAVAAAHPKAVVAAGSVCAVGQLRAAKDAGAAFAVCPGATAQLLAANILPLLPAAATASEAMTLAEHGHDFAKFFPAVALGGEAALRAFAAPLPRALFMPTGGINAQNAGGFLALPNVVCVGGSWLATKDDDADSTFRKTKAAAALAANNGSDND